MSKPYQLASGKWFVRWFDETGKRKGKAFSTEAQARAAARRGEVARDDVRAGLTRPKANLTLAEVVPPWLARRPEKRRRDDESRLRIHILPYFGAHNLHAIDAEAIEGFIRHMEAKRTARPGEKNVAGKSLKPMTVKNCLNLIGKILADHGFKSGAAKFKVPTQGYAWISNPDDVGRFLEACRPDWFRIAAALAVYAGLRAGEVAGLRRDAIDFDRALIRVDKSYDGPTKSKHMRFVALSPQLASIVREWLVKQSGELVVMPDGAMLPERSPLAKLCRKACKRAGIVPLAYHSLRHTAASHLAQRVPLPMVGALLGHASPVTTARYAHLDSEAIARDPRMHLDFSAPDAKVLPFPAGNTVATGRRK
jgi:integrase